MPPVFPPQIERLMAALGVDSAVALGREFGISHQTVYNWAGKGEVPDVYLQAAALRSGRSVDWLRTGEGAALHDATAGLNPRERMLLGLYRSAEPDDRAVIERVAALAAERALVERVAARDKEKTK